MDGFALIILGGLAALVLALLLLGRYYPGSGADVLDWKPTRSPEVEVQNELDDHTQMLEAINERRRRRGAAERTEEQIQAEVAEDLRRQHELRDSYLDVEDERQMREAINMRRRARGEAPVDEPDDQ